MEMIVIINNKEFKTKLRNKFKGKMIVLEGNEGAGKTKLLDRLSKYLKDDDDNFIVIKTREPGGTETSEKLRDIIINNDLEPMSEAYLFAVARREHLINKIIPAILYGHTVICDRYIFSSLVYQGVTKELGFNYVKALNEEVLSGLGGIYPDVVLWLDVEPVIGLKRISSNNRETNKFDKESLDFHNKVRSGYEICSEVFKDTFIKIDASKSEDEVFEEVLEKLYNF